jgi:hypothetical protein
MAKDYLGVYGELIRNARAQDREAEDLNLPPAFETAGVNTKRPYVE